MPTLLFLCFYISGYRRNPTDAKPESVLIPQGDGDACVPTKPEAQTARIEKEKMRSTPTHMIGYTY